MLTAKRLLFPMKELEAPVVKWRWEIVLSYIDPFQFGVMAKSSTVHTLIETFHNWFYATDNRKKPTLSVLSVTSSDFPTIGF